MITCQSCGGVIGRDCFNPQECMAITQDMAQRFQDQPDYRGEMLILQDHLKAAHREVETLREQVQKMNDVFTKIRVTAVSWETWGEQPWLPEDLMLEIDGVMLREHRE